MTRETTIVRWNAQGRDVYQPKATKIARGLLYSRLPWELVIYCVLIRLSAWWQQVKVIISKFILLFQGLWCCSYTCVCSATVTALTDESEVVVMSTINSYRSLFVSANASCLFATYLTAGINVIYVISISSSLFRHKCLSRFREQTFAH